ncbi:hypothetical protein DL93DRAFT_2082043 [Clavulina sp. PMI_390]|nr:hypothetical protein DL93DRAFT_2082043 [Clavulina sp. PMI_390]
MNDSDWVRDVTKLKRHPIFEADYHANNVVLREKYGSVANYVVNVRLKWDLDQQIDPAVKPYFTTDIPDDLVQIIFNDWPYSVPEGVTHYVVWSRLPLVYRDLMSVEAWDHIAHDGLCDFTGSSMRFKPDGPLSEEIALAGKEMDMFVKKVFPENEWECAWFMNPTRTQSIPSLAHFHVFARKKSTEESGLGAEEE